MPPPQRKSATSFRHLAEGPLPNASMIKTFVIGACEEFHMSNQTAKNRQDLIDKLNERDPKAQPWDEDKARGRLKYALQ